MHLGYRYAEPPESEGELFDFDFGGGEDERALGAVGCEEGLEYLGFLGFGADVGVLAHAFDGLAECYLDSHGVVEHLVGQEADFMRHGGREEQCLSVLGEEAQDLSDVVDESHVEHSVGFVEHEEREGREVEIAYREVGEESSGCGYDDVGSEP